MSAAKPTSRRVVYFVRNEENGLVKIGFSADLQHRLRRMRVDASAALTLIGTIPGGPAAERAAHRRFEADRVHGEWFKASDALERVAKGHEPLEAIDAFAAVGRPTGKPVASRPPHGPGRDEFWFKIAQCFQAGCSTEATCEMLQVTPERLKKHVTIMRELGYFA